MRGTATIKLEYIRNELNESRILDTGPCITRCLTPHNQGRRAMPRNPAPTNPATPHIAFSRLPNKAVQDAVALSPTPSASRYPVVSRSTKSISCRKYRLNESLSQVSSLSLVIWQYRTEILTDCVYRRAISDSNHRSQIIHFRLLTTSNPAEVKPRSDFRHSKTSICKGTLFVERLTMQLRCDRCFQHFATDIGC
jgi:hypothetical protein